MTLNEVWHRVGSLRRNVHFWPVFDQFVRLAYQPAMLEVHSDSQTYGALLNVSHSHLNTIKTQNFINMFTVTKLKHVS